MHVLPDEVDQLVRVLTGRRHPHRPGPVVVHVGELVGEVLHVGGGHDVQAGLAGRLADHDEVGGRDGAHVDVLRHEEEVLEVPPRHRVVEDGARRRVVVVALEKEEN